MFWWNSTPMAGVPPQTRQRSGPVASLAHAPVAAAGEVVGGGSSVGAAGAGGGSIGLLGGGVSGGPSVTPAEPRGARLRRSPTAILPYAVTARALRCRNMDGVSLRPASATDLPAICALVNRSEAHDGVPRLLTLDELTEELDGVHIRFDDDVRVAEADGELVGHIFARYLPSEVREERCYLRGTVDPTFRGRGVGRALVMWGVDRATRLLRSSGRDLPQFIRVDAYDFVDSAHRLFARQGFAPVRVFEELLRSIDELLEVPTIDGVRIIAWPDESAGRDDEIRVQKNLAFADHWGSTPTQPHDWAHQVRGAGARPDLSLVALDDDDRVVAHCLNHRYEADDAVVGRSDGWIGSLGTSPGWRGRGLGSALIAASLRAFAGAGLTHASIGVDSDSLTGAARLYRNLGFELRQRAITHQIEVS